MINVRQTYISQYAEFDRDRTKLYNFNNFHAPYLNDLHFTVETNNRQLFSIRIFSRSQLYT